MVIFHGSPTPTIPQLPVAQTPPPQPKPAAPPKEPEKPKHSPEELAFAEKLAAFLDIGEETMKMLEDAPKPDKINEQIKKLKTHWEAVPPPPSGVAWAESVVMQCKLLVGLTDAIPSTLGLGMAEEALLGGSDSLGKSVDADKAAYREIAKRIREFLKIIRDQIPPDCLPKPG